MKLTDSLYAYPWESMQENNCNAFLIKTGSVNALIDPGHLHLLPELEHKMDQDGFSFDDVGLAIATHPHPDHCEGLIEFHRRRAKIALHEEAQRFIRELGPVYQQMTGIQVAQFEPDFLLQEGRLTLGEEAFQVIETPGHAPGSICLYWERARALITGDVVFQGSVGRVDLPGGDPNLLMESINRLADLDVELLLPGHGPPISGRSEVKENFLRIKSLFYSAF